MARTFFKADGYFVELLPKAAKKPRYKHSICGPHDIPGAECMTCRRPFLRMMTLDLEDDRLAFIPGVTREELVLEGPELHLKHTVLKDLPLFFCWACGNGVTYLLNKGGGVDVLDHTRLYMSNREPDRPDYPHEFPLRWLRLEPIDPKVQNVIHRENQGQGSYGDPEFDSNRRFLRPKHQVGGEPYLIQGNRDGTTENCTLCDRAMPVVAVVADDNGCKGGFVGDSFTQVIFSYCAECQVVSALHQCD